LKAFKEAYEILYFKLMESLSHDNKDQQLLLNYIGVES